ncbi:hypothetical protein P4V86_03200 [Brevibacillus laterosporus]|uniref:hypothetical protein n=1 Tax=Brevibacillus laterosporus TaxID=1465 RepID=UPI000369AF2D|nr:hypothetical protein [Brevibacillus laterosporus]ATO48530.1 hypothetical protein BrL25_05035 [Brevibacillus laterosporus DSM 25]MED2002364.1 hypothetical protein [Brevibacillus laterosporus]
MRVTKHAPEFATKTFAATSAGEVDAKIDEWQDSNPNALVLGMELSSHWNELNQQVEYVVLMTYQVGEKDGV